MTNTLIGLSIIGGIIIILYAIMRQFTKLDNTRKKIELEKKYVTHTKAKLKITGQGDMFVPLQDVLIYFFPKYIIALAPDDNNETNSHNIVFFKNDEDISKKDHTSKAKIRSFDYNNNLLTMTATIFQSNLASMSLDFAVCEILFDNINDTTLNAIRRIEEYCH